jgi:hypothetical protein
VCHGPVGISKQCGMTAFKIKSKQTEVKEREKEERYGKRILQYHYAIVPLSPIIPIKNDIIPLETTPPLYSTFTVIVTHNCHLPAPSRNYMTHYLALTAIATEIIHTTMQLYLTSY